MRRLKAIIAIPALLLLLGYIWLRSLPYHTVRRGRQLARWSKAWAKVGWRMLTKLRYERPSSVSRDRTSWFIWCPNCHSRFGMAVQKGGMIDLRIGPKQNRFTIDQPMAARLSLKCGRCGKPVPILLPEPEPTRS